MKIRLILFDLGGVIYTSDRHEAVRRFGSLGLKDAENQLNMYTQTGLFGALEEGKISDKEFVAQLSDKVGKSLSWDDCRLAWLGYATFLPQRNLDVLLRLRHMGFRLALASNTNPFMMSWRTLTRPHPYPGSMESRVKRHEGETPRGLLGSLAMAH